jgi:hypothetical protein
MRRAKVIGRASTCAWRIKAGFSGDNSDMTSMRTPWTAAIITGASRGNPRAGGAAGVKHCEKATEI